MIYDAIVIGSGITGGWAAKELTEKGLATLVIERGRNVEHRKDYITEHKPNWQFPLRNRAAVGGDARRAGVPDPGAHGPIPRVDQTLLHQGPPQSLRRGQAVHLDSGRSGRRQVPDLGRQVYRWSDLDFEANLRDGHGVDWPIRYADIAPWYSYVERFIGVSGEKLGLRQLPDGEFQPPMEMNAGEKFVKTGLERAFPDRHLTIGRVAILTQALNGRLPCHYCGPCERGCSTGSYFSSQASTLPPRRPRAASPLSPTVSSTPSSTTPPRTALPACASWTRRRNRCASIPPV